MIVYFKNFYINLNIKLWYKNDNLYINKQLIDTVITVNSLLFEYHVRYELNHNINYFLH